MLFFKKVTFSLNLLQIHVHCKKFKNLRQAKSSHSKFHQPETMNVINLLYIPLIFFPIHTCTSIGIWEHTTNIL